MPSKKEKLPLSITHPELSEEADGWDPKEIGPGSTKKLGWKCMNNHTWNAVVNSRTSGKRGCPYCSNNKIWPGFNDIATTHSDIARTIIEFDATSVSAGSEKVAKWKCELGHTFEMDIKKRVIRGYGCPYCTNSKVLSGFNDFATKHPRLALEAYGWDSRTVVGGSAVFRDWKCPLGHIYNAKVSSRDASDSGCPFCSNHRVLTGFNDLATTHPELAAQADGWDPTQIISSSKKFKWVCTQGHKTIAQISVRKSGSGCRVCSNQEVLFGYNDLKTKFPHIAKEADGWDPKKVVSGSNKHMDWKCLNGHKWKATIASRTNLEAGCPTCSIGGGFNPNGNGYLYFLEHPLWHMFQIGITNVPEDRLNRHKKLGWEVIEVRGPMDGHLTKDWETGILRMLRAKGADLSNEKIAGRFDGYSEAWSKSTFEVRSIKELMRITEEFEELKDSASAKSPRPSKSIYLDS